MREHKKGYAKVSSFKMNEPDNQLITALNLKGIFNLHTGKRSFSVFDVSKEFDVDNEVYESSMSVSMQYYILSMDISVSKM